MRLLEPIVTFRPEKYQKSIRFFTQNDKVRKSISYSENGVGIPRSNDIFLGNGKVTQKSSQNLIKIRVELDFLGMWKTAFRKVPKPL